jgi:hypothetical protein
MNTQGSIASAPKQGAPRRGFKTYLWGGVAAAILVTVLYTLFILWWSFSEGERAGVLQKFSERGWVCKTYEGELAQYVVGGVAPQIWHFSVRDEAVVEQLHKAVGQQVRIHYSEHPGLPTDCFGETDYFADGVEIMAPAVTMPSPSGLAVESAAQPRGAVQP